MTIPDGYDEITQAPYLACPRFHRCSVNRCPLDPRRDARESLAEDPEPRCTLEKRVRMRIAASHPDLLPWRGLKPRELASLTRWEALPEAERERIAARGRAVLASRAGTA